MVNLTSCQLEANLSVIPSISAQVKILSDIAVCDIMIDDAGRRFYIRFKLLNTEEG
jgi:hypothetical protein